MRLQLGDLRLGRGAGLVGLGQRLALGAEDGEVPDDDEEERDATGDGAEPPHVGRHGLASWDRLLWAVVVRVALELKLTLSPPGWATVMLRTHEPARSGSFCRARSHVAAVWSSPLPVTAKVTVPPPPPVVLVLRLAEKVRILTFAGIRPPSWPSTRSQSTSPFSALTSSWARASISPWTAVLAWSSVCSAVRVATWFSASWALCWAERTCRTFPAPARARRPVTATIDATAVRSIRRACRAWATSSGRMDSRIRGASWGHRASPMDVGGSAP